jgi:glycosyltransferase involved in cell wall biosynthesis
MRIGVPKHVVDLPEQMGHGRVWHNLLRELSRSVKIVPGGGRRVDAWLSDAGAGPVITSKPVVTHLHEAPWTVPELRGQVTEEFLAVIEPLVAEAVAEAACVVTVSENAAGIIRSGFPGTRVAVAHNGVDHGVFHPRAAPDLGGPYVLFAATVHPRKNLAALREAMRSLPEYRLAVVAGPAVDRADSAELERELLAPLPGGLVRIERPSDVELAALMSGCAAFCLPSLWEGFGLTAAEAMACGARVVVSDRGALPEVVDDAGVVVEPTPEAIAAGLRAALADDSLPRRAIARAQHFTWARCAGSVLQAIRSVL